MADFTDLRARTLSALAMAAVGLVAIWLGGPVFAALAVVLAGLMGWEAHRLAQPGAPEGAAMGWGLASALLVAAFGIWVHHPLGLVGLLVGAATLAWRLPSARVSNGAYLAMILVAAQGLILLREQFGASVVLWLVGVVIASDVAGYFAGRMLGGPKFWPRISPKKTWSGTIAGWILAALVGLGFVIGQGQPWWFVPLSALFALAGQMGDIAESALKRRAGVKDSSALIPGHGGVLDRFDALIAVAALASLLLHGAIVAIWFAVVSGMID